MANRRSMLAPPDVELCSPARALASAVGRHLGSAPKVPDDPRHRSRRLQLAWPSSAPPANIIPQQQLLLLRALSSAQQLTVMVVAALREPEHMLRAGYS